MGAAFLSEPWSGWVDIWPHAIETNRRWVNGRLGSSWSPYPIHIELGGVEQGDVEATLFMYSLSAHCLLRHVNCLGPDKVRFNLIPNVVLVIALVF